MTNKWTDEEISLLVSQYSLIGSLVSTQLNRSIDSVKHKARQLNLLYSYEASRQSKIDILLEDTLLTYYWIGFILADGHIENTNRLTVCLNQIDGAHLQKFADYIQCPTLRYYRNTVIVSAQNKIVLPEVSKKFDIANNKTKHPPKDSIFQSMNIKLLLSLIIGFIDGDGCIRTQFNRKDCLAQIKGYSTWISIFRIFETRLNELFDTSSNTVKINTSGYAQFCLSHSKLEYLLLFAQENNIPILMRKWNKLN